MGKDYYAILGVERKSTREEIKKAYKKLALKYHPDRAPEDKEKEYEEKFKEINEAAAVLGDDKKRQQYDQFGSDSFRSGGQGYQGFDFSDMMSQFRSGSFGNFEDIFDHIFSGGQGRRSSKVRGSDLVYETEITLEDVSSGTEKTIQLNKLEPCPSCAGKGAKKFESCQQCHGSGYLKRTQRTPFGLFQQSGPCSYCHGQGELPRDSCPECAGEGLVRKKKKLDVTIPAGVEEGMRLRLAGEGEASPNGGPNGDLYILVRVRKHQIFNRERSNLNLSVPISFTQAVLGDNLEVPTINGRAELQIPPGTQPGTIFRMRGKGLPAVHDQDRGDQMVQVQIEVPKKLTKRQKELVQQLKEEKPSKSFLQNFWG